MQTGEIVNFLLLLGLSDRCYRGFQNISGFLRTWFTRVRAKKSSRVEFKPRFFVIHFCSSISFFLSFGVRNKFAGKKICFFDDGIGSCITGMKLVAYVKLQVQSLSQARI